MAKQTVEMVRIKMLTSAAGPQHTLRVDHEYDWPKHEAVAWEEQGVCEILGPAKGATK